MYLIERSFDIAMGHRLSKHEGNCKHFHGHNYKILVGVRAKHLDDNGMVLDFSELDKIVKTFLKKFDHCLVVNLDDEVCNEMSETLLQHGMKVVALPYEPTAENFASEIYRYVASKLPPSVEMDYVTVFENERSKAVYYEE